MKNRARVLALTDPGIVVPAIGESFRKLDPRTLIRNPVMFVVEVVALVSTILFVRDLAQGVGDPLFSGQIVLWLWFTVLFANFAEAVAEGRGKAQAANLRKTRTETIAKRLRNTEAEQYDRVPAPELRVNDVVLVEANELIPGDGEVIEGVATVDEFGDHRRIRAGHPRERRRPVGGHRRHQGVV